MADTPEHHLMTRAALDERAMRTFLEGLQQARKALRDTDHMVTGDRTTLVDPDRWEEPEQEPE